MKELINEIVKNLERDYYHNESEISRGVVLRIISKLGWDIYDTNKVMSEYAIGTGRVDFALSASNGRRPSVFIEVKQPGKTENADEQLFNYAFKEGVPFAILTDGKTWSFYLPSGQGKYEERRIYKLDICERSADETVEKFERYLRYDRIKSSAAFDDAQKDYKNRYRQNEAKQSIPESWKELIDNEDNTLFTLLSESVEKKCGYKPQRSDIVDFFLDIRFPAKQTFEKKSNPKDNVPVVIRTDSTKCGSWYRLNDKTKNVRSAKDVVIGILTDLYSIDKDIFNKCYSDERNMGRNRTYIGKSINELYPERKDLEVFNSKLPGGWYLMTNFSNAVKNNIISMAIDLLGYKKGREIDYNL